MKKITAPKRIAKSKKVTVETAAEVYAEGILPEVIEKYTDAPWPEFRQTYTDTFKAGATYALGNQWRDPAEELPGHRENILIAYQSYHKGRYLTLYTQERYQADMGFMYGTIRTKDVIAWMPIPELPKRGKNEPEV